MPEDPCIRIRLPRALFRKLLAKAIEERTDLNSMIIRAVLSDLPLEDRARPKGRRDQRRISTSRIQELSITPAKENRTPGTSQ
jgi:hypothetical protein